MKVQKLVSVISILLVLPMSAQEIPALQLDKSLKKLYSAVEMESFSKMIKYTDSVVLAFDKTDNVEKAYHIFLDSLNVAIETGKDHNQAIDEIKKYGFLEGLDSSVIHDIWYESNTSGKIILKDTVVENLNNFKTLSLAPESRFTHYLLDTGPMPQFYRKLGQTINAVGNLSAGDFFGFIDSNSNFDFKMVKNRLWASIFILNLSETTENKFERWLTKNPN